MDSLAIFKMTYNADREWIINLYLEPLKILPYPCGNFGNPKKECRCSPAQVERYRAKISGPLLDRIDIHVEAPAVEFRDLSSNVPAEASSAIRERVLAARERQTLRFARTKNKNKTNGRMSHRATKEFCAHGSESSAPWKMP